ncbi:hypothetical protein [Campylobacter sp. VTCC 70190]|uniref:hypothetical protein n=1 Tax=Campylobacter sp. VTCC 70190 TaxID=3392118 RepID=UPI00398EB0B1
MIMVTDCGTFETENYGRTKMGKNVLKLSLEAEEKESKESKNKNEATNESDENTASNAKKDRYKSSKLVDISA